jgi:antitoxin HicB
MHARDYRIEITPLTLEEGGGYLAWVPDLPGCMCDGDTRAEALAKAEPAITRWLNEARRRGRPIPKPQPEEIRHLDLALLADAPPLAWGGSPA